MHKSRKWHSYFLRHIVGFHYVVRIFIGTTLLWLLLHSEQTADSLWAIISMIVVTEPQVKPAWLAFRSRIINTVIGSAVGLVFLMLFGVRIWMLTPALTVSAFISSYINRVQQGWRIAPVTTTLIMSAAMTQKSSFSAIELALHRTMEVFLGSAMAVLVAWVMAFVWLPVSEPADKK